MSLWCGNCANEIFEEFGILYRLGLTVDGALRYPDKLHEYVPPNVAVCAGCWSRLPPTKMHPRSEAQKLDGIVYAYAPADSDRVPFFGSKAWSSIRTRDDQIVLITSDVVVRCLPRAVRAVMGILADKEKP